MNDEAHHCYREKPGSDEDEDEDEDLKGDDKKEAEKNKEAARMWITGLEAVKRKLGISRVIDLSATPFFLSGSGYVEGTLFPWTMCDFCLMDAIECGIVKLPRVPVADNIPGEEMPVFRELWKHIGKNEIKAILDPYNPTGSTNFVNFNTSKTDRWETSSQRCQINWAILDSDWEAEFCRVAEAHPHVKSYVKNHNLGLEVPYLFGSTTSYSLTMGMATKTCCT